MFIAPLAGRSPRARSFRDRQRSWRADKDGSIALSQTSSGLSGCANAHAAIIGSRPLSWAAILSRSLLLFVNIASRSTPKSEPSRQRSKAFRTLSKTLKGQCESLTHIRVLSSPGSWRRRERAPPMKQRANKAPEPTPLPVTSRAYARLAPGSGVAHLWRWAISRNEQVFSRFSWFAFLKSLVLCRPLDRREECGRAPRSRRFVSLPNEEPQADERIFWQHPRIRRTRYFLQTWQESHPSSARGRDIVS